MSNRTAVPTRHEAADAAQQVAEPLRPLPDEVLERRIRQMPRAPLSHGALKRMSLAGAQHKLAVVLREGMVIEPAGATPSTHIMKPDHPDTEYPHSAISVCETAGLSFTTTGRSTA